MSATLTDKLHEALQRHGVESRDLARLLADIAAKHTSQRMRKGVQRQTKAWTDEKVL